MNADEKRKILDAATECDGECPCTTARLDSEDCASNAEGWRPSINSHVCKCWDEESDTECTRGVHSIAAGLREVARA